MNNLKKSLILLVTLGNMQQVVPMLGTTTDSRPPVTNMLGTTTDSKPPVAVQSAPTPNIRITGLKPNESGLYDSDNKTALLIDEKAGTITTYKQVVPVSKAIRYNLAQGSEPFATMPNPQFTGKKMMGGEREKATLFGVVSSTETQAHRKPLLGGRGGMFRGITIYGFEAGQKGLYDRQSKMANLDGRHYTVICEYTPAHAGTMVPRSMEGGELVAYIQNNLGVTQKVGAAPTKTYLYGVPAASNVVE